MNITLRAFVVSFCVILTGCATSPKNKWDTSKSILPCWDSVKRSAATAANDTYTWAPLTTAFLFTLNNYDQKTLDWATKEEPRYWGLERAKKKSNEMLDALKANLLISSLAANANSNSRLAYDLGFQLTAIGLNHAATKTLKQITDRKRIDRDVSGTSKDSFPSSHASSAAIITRLTANNIDRTNISQVHKNWWKFSTFTAAALTGVERVKGKRHYPSDVFAGYALGNFLGIFLTELFVPEQDQSQVQVNLLVVPNGELGLLFFYQW